MWRIGVFLLAACSRSPLVAQTTPADGGTREVLESIFIPATTDAPFTLTLATEWVKPLGTDGNTVTLVNQRRIARDRNGRIFQERVLLTPKGMKLSDGPNVLQFADPAQHTVINCFLATRQCHIIPYTPEPAAQPDTEAGTTTYRQAVEHRKPLGKDMMDGVEVQGTESTTVIAAGAFGNSKPVTIARTFWYSPALGINLKSTRDDPRSGEQCFTVTHLSRDEPDPALWQVPADFTIVDDRPPQKP